MSVENVPDANRQWFVLRVLYGRIIKAKALVEAKGFECYVPMRYKEIKTLGRKRIVTEPLISSFVFVHSIKGQINGMIIFENVMLPQQFINVY